MANLDGRIFVDIMTNPHRGVEIRDLQLVLQRGTNDLGLLCSDQEWSGSGSSATLVPANKINRWAKFKPFRNANQIFPFDGTQSTPASRSIERLKAARSALFGLTIPRYNGNDFKTNYATPWGRAYPRGASYGSGEWFRLLDFDGYLHENFWSPGVISNNRLLTIFDGTLDVGGLQVMTNDWLNFGIQCTEDPDVGLPGTLYPNDFDAAKYNLSDDYYVLSKYYMGIGLLHDSSQTLLVATGDRMLVHDPDNPDSGWTDESSIYAMMRVQIPSDSNLPQGYFKAIPLLAENSTGGAWWTSGFGNLISLDGAFIQLQKVTAINGLSINVTITVNASNLQVSFSVQNVSNHDITVNDIYGFIMSGEAVNDDPDGHISGIPYDVDPYVTQFIDDNWPGILSVLSNAPNIYLSDRQPDNPDTGRPWPDYPFGLCARGYNAYTDFIAANPYTTDRRVLRQGSAAVTWSKTFNYTGDDYGFYDSMYAAIQLCFSITGANFTQMYYSE